ncbi:MAG: hypothetical protein QOC71_1616 [Thermoplasmata archaeon]|nr:hypothetical protein [Thermoplasmata archaeon]
MALRDRRWAAPLFLAVASPVLAEVLTGNIPPSQFIVPPIFVLMLIAYGIPVLLIRDAWVRLGLGVPGLFVLGLAYGFVNEALFAKTVFMDVALPVPNFDGYRESGVNWAFASFIVPWHALHSVVYPIAFAWWLFPARRADAWLGRKTSLALFAVMVAVGLLVHSGADNVQGTATSFVLSLTLIGSLVLLGLVMPRRPALLDDGPDRRGIAWIGAGIAVFLFLTAAMADARLPTPVLVAISACFFVGLFFLVRWRGGFHAPAFLRLALGNELAFVLITLAFDASVGAVERFVSHVVLELVFIAALLRLRNESRAAALARPIPE